MRKLISQVAQLVSTAAEAVAKHARELSDTPAAPTPSPSPSGEPAALVHLVACESCHAQYDVTGYASQSLRCRCGHLVKVGTAQAVQRPIERCGACGGPLQDGAQTCGFCGGQVERDARALSLLCPECFAANPRRGQFCNSCGVAPAPEPVGAGERTKHTCPVCAVSLFQRRLLNAWVEECPECHGLFIASTHLQHLAQHASRPDKPASSSSPTPVKPASDVVVYRRCPECNQLMLRRNYGRTSGVVVDECNLHGHWLDANELEAIGRFISSGEQTRANERAAKEAAQAKRERQREWDRRDRPSFLGVLLGDD